jgi:hypothetical protein
MYLFDRGCPFSGCRRELDLNIPSILSPLHSRRQVYVVLYNYDKDVSLSVEECFCSCVCLALPVMAAPDTVRFGGFTQTATFSVASQLGFFNHNNLNVTFLQIPNSTFGYAQILNGGYDFLTGTIDDAVNLRFNSNKNLTVLGHLDAGPDLTIASVHNITSI